MELVDWAWILLFVAVPATTLGMIPFDRSVLWNLLYLFVTMCILFLVYQLFKIINVENDNTNDNTKEYNRRNAWKKELIISTHEKTTKLRDEIFNKLHECIKLVHTYPLEIMNIKEEVRNKIFKEAIERMKYDYQTGIITDAWYNNKEFLSDGYNEVASRVFNMYHNVDEQITDILQLFNLNKANRYIQ